MADDAYSEADGPSGPKEGSGELTEHQNATVAVRRGPLAAHQLDAVAILSLNGVAYDDIAGQVGCSTDQVKHLVRDKANHTFNALVAGYREKILTHSVQHRMKMMKLMNASYEAVENAIQQRGDARLAKDTAFQVFKEALPAPETPKQEMQVNLGFQNVHLQQEVTTSTNEMLGKLPEILNRLGEVVGTVDPHTRKGTAALPQAYSQPDKDTEEVVDADFSSTDSEA